MNPEKMNAAGADEEMNKERLEMDAANRHRDIYSVSDEGDVLPPEETQAEQ